MKKLFLGLLTGTLIVFGYYFLITKNDSNITYKLEGKSYRLLVADEPGEWERGLSQITKLENADGIIFIFPDKEYRNFWNKNTHLDLDIYWLDEDKVVGKSSLPSIEKSKKTVSVYSSKKVNKVIEILSSR